MADTDTLRLRVVTQPSDRTLFDLMTSYNDGDLIVDPYYQRNFIYTFPKASKLIESILIGIPIPPVYLCINSQDKTEIIDGQQRIVSICKFMNNEFSLRGLKDRSEFNGKYWKNLDKSVQKIIKEYPLRCITLIKECEDAKFDIFERLNQGSVELKEQEIRNCVYRGSFNTALNELAASIMKKDPLISNNDRMAMQEIILRYFAFKNLDNYSNGMKETLNNYMKLHRNDSSDDIKKMKIEYRTTLRNVRQVMGPNAFKAYKQNSSGELNNKFSPTVYDSLMIPFSEYSSNMLMRHADEIRTKIDEIKRNDSEYNMSIYGATGSKRHVEKRINTIKNLLFTIMSSETEQPRTFTEEQKKILFEKSNVCAWCHQEILRLEDCVGDHIVPYSKGGKTEISNGQVLHISCNLAKSNSEKVDEDE